MGWVKLIFGLRMTPASVIKRERSYKKKKKEIPESLMRDRRVIILIFMGNEYN